MQTGDLYRMINYVENHSFEGMVFDTPEELEIKNHQFAIARLSDYGACPSYDILVKYITEKGGTVKEKAVKSVDYLIITPTVCDGSGFIYKNEKDKYEKAIQYRKGANKPLIIRDLDFFIYNNLFSKLKIEDKRRVVMEYNKDRSLFSEKAASKIERFIFSKGRDDPYLKTKDLKVLNQAASGDIDVGNLLLLIPDEKECRGFTFKNWKKYFNLSEGQRLGRKGLMINKCKALNTSIRVPDVIEGKPVVAVDTDAFRNLGDFVKEVYIPFNVVFIENSAFLDCPDLERIVIRNPECQIQRYAFLNCPSLKEIIIGGINIALDERFYTDDYNVIPFDLRLLRLNGVL